MMTPSPLMGDILARRLANGKVDKIALRKLHGQPDD